MNPSPAASSGATLRALALHGCGIACLADFLVGPDIAAGRLEAVRLPEQRDWKQPIWAVFYKQGRRCRASPAWWTTWRTRWLNELKLTIRSSPKTLHWR
ncbi:LysR substrate binding domain [Chromobacterium violaceum]|uniref:LysR substrate binding domain n=1 Tax=Chromobacterium violaceum TaxID=536 RepID=A0A447T6P0_CHRVL|nr:LysR substrate binding domain [Chromobacterium violaceum]